MFNLAQHKRRVRYDFLFCEYMRIINSARLPETVTLYSRLLEELGDRPQDGTDGE